MVTPHNAGEAPAGILSAALDPLLGEGDPDTNLILHAPEAHTLHASVSRFVVDLNRDRAEGDDNGIIKLTDFEGEPLYSPDFHPGGAASPALLGSPPR